MSGGAGATVVAIDPGTEKCGMAVVRRLGEASKVLFRGIIPPDQACAMIQWAIEAHEVGCILVGGGTGSRQVLEMTRQMKILPVVRVDEQYTTLLARRRFFSEHPPRGLRRLIPRSLQTPSVPYDDYVAVILAERHLQQQADDSAASPAR